MNLEKDNINEGEEILKNFKVNYYSKKKFGVNISNRLLIFPKFCPNCNKNIILNNYNTLINPYIARHSNRKCKNYFLKK